MSTKFIEKMAQDIQGLPSFSLLSPWEQVLQNVMSPLYTNLSNQNFKSRTIPKTTKNNKSYRDYPPFTNFKQLRRQSFSEGKTNNKIIRFNTLYPITVVQQQNFLKNVKNSRRNAIRHKLKTFFRRQALLQRTTTIWMNQTSRNNKKMPTQIIQPKEMQNIQIENIKYQKKTSTLEQKIQSIALFDRNRHSSTISLLSSQLADIIQPTTSKKTLNIQSYKFKPQKLVIDLQHSNFKYLGQNQKQPFLKQLPTIGSTLQNSKQNSVQQIYLTPNPSRKISPKKFTSFKSQIN